MMATPRILIALTLATLVAAQSSPAYAAENIITVTGEASVSVAPDMALMRIGVTTVGKTAREASEANAKQMTAVLAAIEQSGIPDRDVQTSQLSVQPQYDPSDRGTARLTGFQVTNRVTVRIRNVDAMPMILDRAIAAGANEMSGIEFVVSEHSKILDEARAEAIADARRKAELYARAAGAKLGRVVSITEEGSGAPPRPVMQAMRAGAVPVAPGEQTLRSTVTVSYRLE